MNRKVVVTGLGAVTPLGLNVSTLWANIQAGKSGISKLSRFNAEVISTNRIPRIAGQVDLQRFRLFVAQNENLGIDASKISKVDLACLYGVASAREAILDACLSEEVLREAGVVAGCIYGGAETIDAGGRVFYRENARIKPSFIATAISSSLASQISIIHGCQGGSYTINAACATGAYAIHDAWFKIKHGLWDFAVVSCADACLTPMHLAGLGSMHQACSTRDCRPEEASRPFDIERDGFVPSEGGGAVVLETLERADARGAKIYAEVAGCAISSDASDMIQPNILGLVRCMRSALRTANMNPEDVVYVNAHGTSTKPGDPKEIEAINTVFGKNIAVSSSKSELGHLMGAAGVVEFCLTVLALIWGIIPPTINLQHVDPNCDLVDIVGPHARPIKTEGAFATNSCGFGGLNSTLIVKKV
jgi:3-oxoacyl-[acyl-carrier-protein] synthase II